MARIRLRYVQGFVAHGRAYYYFRKPGCARIPLPGSPFSDEFMAAYRAALVAADAPPTDIGAKRNAPGTIAALVAAYAGSDGFRNLATETRRNRWVILRRFGDEHGDKRVAMLKREHVEAMLRNKRPFPRQNFLKALRPLLQFAVSLGWCKEDPTRELRATAKRGPGFRPWGEEQIEAFRARHSLGSRARLALELLLGTAQRRADAVRMGPQHVREREVDGELQRFLYVKQQKTGVELELPILPEVQAALDATPSGHLTFLTTKSGKPFSSAGLGDWFRDRCNEAGLQGFSAHGLRHTACTRLANTGATGHEIAAWSGHGGLREVSRYTRSADQRTLAHAAAIKLATSLSKPANPFDKSRKKLSTNKG
jgi:integrase